MKTDELLARAQAVTRLPTPSRRRTIRERAGATQAELAAALGVSKQALERWERGDAKPRGHHAAAYVVLLERLEEAADFATSNMAAPKRAAP
jgi:DNA-binding transcriptional regulator YiaG